GLWITCGKDIIFTTNSTRLSQSASKAGYQEDSAGKTARNRLI
ncbi:hypothetical protein AVDCRST_MAG81-373, partial [uncultured Synechococcales cyanobacterium]